MSITMYNASVPIFKQQLDALIIILGKAEAHAIENNITLNTLLHAKLFPDMLDLIRQVQIASDFAKGVSARLAGVDVPVFEDNEASFQELQARIAKTLHFISSLDPTSIEGSEERTIVTREGTPKEKTFTGQHYLLHYGIPQFFFHITTAYAILRINGITIGKRDYMGVF